jgi:hypothetical protein
LSHAVQTTTVRVLPTSAICSISDFSEALDVKWTFH